MRYALIDNSTLTAVQRILGEIPIKNKYTIDGDILALENYIQSILFYDEIVYLDDYKENYRIPREKFFNNMMKFKPSEIGYQSLIKTTKGLTEDIIPCVEGGKFTDDNFKKFFELLKMNVTFTWDLNSSVYYLTQKMLEEVGGIDVPKYSKLSNMIYMELQEKSRIRYTENYNNKVLYDSHGNKIDSSYKILSTYGGEKDALLSQQVQAFFSGLNWLAFRTILYTLIAKQMDVELILHPIRYQFQINLLSKINIGKQDVFRNVIGAMNGNVCDTFNKIVENTQPFVLQQSLPLFTVWLAYKTEDPTKFVDEAYNMRESKEFVQARKTLKELEELQNENNSKFVIKANKLVRQINKQMEDLRCKYGLNTSQGISSSKLISVWNTAAFALKLPQIPGLDMDIKAMSFIRNILPGKGFKGIYRNLIDDLTTISRLGRYYDIISSNIKLANDAKYYDSKTEKPEYSRVKSWWKSPM